LGQDGSFAAGMIAGVPAGLYDAVDGIVKTASSPVETYEALKTLFNSGDLLGNVSDAVKQSYIDRINRMEVEYQKAGASGSFNAGVEGGKLVTDIAGLLAGGAGVVKGGALLTEKVVAKVAGKAESAAATTISGAESSINNIRLNMQLTAEQAAGVRAPTKITSYSQHALEQIAGRDGGIGVNKSAMDDAWSRPLKIEYVPSKYGPTFRYTGKDAVIVVNQEGKVVTGWAKSSSGTAK